MVVGERGAQFWQEHARLYSETCEAVAIDLGHDGIEDAPAAARAAIAGLAQALIVRDAAYRRVLEEGGPLTAKGRTRRAADVHERYDRRVEAWCRQLGLDRRAAGLTSTAEVLAAQPRRGGGS